MSITALAKRAGTYIELVKLEHALFDMPFTVMAVPLAYAAPGPHAPSTAWLWIILASLFAYISGMGFNRLADSELDARNPRTRTRALPAGIVTRWNVRLLTVSSAAIFIFSAAMLNRVCLLLSPAALAFVWTYSYSKRFTALSHLWLGAALGLAPIGVWLAVLGRLDATPILLGFAVTLWTAGFDIIYACQDFDFDRAAGLHSMPAKAGMAAALWISAAFHLFVIVLLLLIAHTASLGWIYLAGVIAAAAVLAYEHAIVKPNDLSRVNVAFFTANGIVSIMLMSAAILDVTFF